MALPPSYPLRRRVQDHISEAATIRENPQVCWWGEQLVVAWLDGVFDLQACELLERFSSSLRRLRFQAPFAREKQLLVGARCSLLRYFDEDKRNVTRLPL